MSPPDAARSASPKYASRRPERRISSPRSTKTRFSTTLSPPRPTARARHTSPKCPRAKGARSVGTYPSPAAPDRADAPSFVPAGTASMGAAPTAPKKRFTTALDARGISISALARASGPGASARRRAATPSRPRATMPSSSSHPPAKPADRASNSAESSSPGASARPERYTSGQFGQRDTGLARGITSSSENTRSHAFSRPTQASPDAAMVAGRRIEPGSGFSCRSRDPSPTSLDDRTLTREVEGLCASQPAAAIAATATRHAVHGASPGARVRAAICRPAPPPPRMCPF